MPHHLNSPVSLEQPAPTPSSCSWQVHLSADGAHLLTADDFGEVKLFHAPCVVEDAPYNVGAGHSSHVSCVRFLKGDRAAVSAGSKDRAIIRWELGEMPPPDGCNAEQKLLPDMPWRDYLLAPQVLPRKGRLN